MGTRVIEMMKGKWSAIALRICCVVFATSVRPAGAQIVSGTINDYARAVAFDYCQNTATVASTQAFKAGDEVFIIQMTGAVVDLTNSASFGTVLNDGSVGTCEWARIRSVPDGATILFENVLLNRYNTTSGIAQIVRVPIYTDAITGLLKVKPWDAISGTGGVFVLRASGSIDIVNTISATGCGYSGGSPSENGGGSNLADYFCTTVGGLGGEKGEGASQMAVGYQAGRGSPANGGGGGNTHNAGGGGGGSMLGNGGAGGDQTNEPGFGRFANGGVGGKPLLGTSPGLPRLVMGGGGGGGHQNDGGGGTGGVGGGIIVLSAPLITFSSGWTEANGSPGTDGTLDGAGGGGAGGTIYLDAKSISSSVVSVVGGAGGNAVCGNSPIAYGPGGGGSGGVIYKPSTTPPGMLEVVAGPAGSLMANTDVNLKGMPYGALPGDAGMVLSTSPIPEGSTTFVPPAADSKNITACQGVATLLSASGADSYLWTPSAGIADPSLATISVTPTTTTTYTVTMQRGGCTFKDNVLVNVLPQPVSAFSGAQDVCLGSTSHYASAAASGVSYSWVVTGGQPASGGGPSLDVIWTQPGTNDILLTAQSGPCTTTTRLAVVVEDKVTPAISGTLDLCEGSSTTLSAPGSYQSYRWSTGETTPTITVNAAGTYGLDVTTAGGCTGSAQAVTVTVHPLPKPAINASLIVLNAPGDQSTLSLSLPYSTYQWSTGETSSGIVVSNPGTYSVTVTDANGCTGVASIVIESPATLPAIELGIPVIQAAAGEHVTIPLSIFSELNLDKGAATDYEVTLRFNGTLLTPVTPPLLSSFNNDERTIVVSGVRGASPTSIGGIECIAALGDSTETAIHFDKIRWLNGKQIQTTLRDGRFVLAGICPAGGNRLFSENGTILLHNAMPNPSSGVTWIAYSIAEDGPVDLAIYDMLGRRVACLVHSDETSGAYRTSFDAGSVADGVYTCVLRTLSESRQTRLQVYH